MADGGATSVASVALSEIARKNLLSEFLALVPRRAELNSRLKELGYAKMGDRAKIEMALKSLTQGVVPELRPAVPIDSAAPPPVGPWIVATHAREDLAWMVPLLTRHPTVRIILYECGIEAVPEEVLRHERIEIRDKSGHLAPVPFFYGVFDFCTAYYDAPLP